MQRDPIFAALLNQLTALTVSPYTVQEVSRGFVPWEAADEQPAIYIVPGTETAEYKRGLPTKWIIHCELWVYVRWVDSVVTGVTALAQLMDSIDYILSPLGPNGGVRSDNGYVNNLNGTPGVVYCAIQGTSEVSGGFLNKSQTVARMPIEIMAA